MAKSQQMRWSRRGADLLLQVRCAVYNGTLGTGFGQRFQAANDPHPKPSPLGVIPTSTTTSSFQGQRLAKRCAAPTRMG
jgi:hypothetical protein